MDLNEAKKNIETAKRIIGREAEDPGSIWFGIAKSMVGIAEWAVGLAEAYDKIQANTQTRLVSAERLSAERNEARLAELAEVNKLRSELSYTKKMLDDSIDTNRQNVELLLNVRDALGLASGQHIFTEAKSIREERDALKVKLDQLTREQAEREKSFREGALAKRLGQIIRKTWNDPNPDRSVDWWDAMAVAVLSDLAQIPVELPSADDISAAWDREIEANISLNPVARQSYVMHGLANWLRTRLAPLLAARQMSKIELPSDDELLDTFIEASAVDEMRERMGIRAVLLHIRKKLGSTEQKPSVIAEVMAIHEDIKKSVQSIEDGDKIRRAISTARPVHIGKAPQGVWDRFVAETRMRREFDDESPIYAADLELLVKILGQ